MKIAPAFDERFRSEFSELLRWRRDVRHFRADPIAPETIEQLVADASLAPSVGYSQPWRFVSVDDAARRAAVVANFERANERALAAYEGDRYDGYARLKLAGLREAPVHLAVFCDGGTDAGHGLGRQTMGETLAYSVVLAIGAFWLAARTRGIGVGWVSILDPDAVARALEVPAGWKLIAYLCVGRPREPDDVPELARAAWQARVPEAGLLHHR